MKSLTRSPATAIGMAIVLLFSAMSATYPPQSQCEYFSNARHYVCDEFLTFYKTRGGNQLFGDPITEAFVDPARGIKVQYFQNFRMEFHPNNPDPYKVLLGLLVDELGYQFPPVSPDQIPRFNSPLHHYFPETGHIVSYSFLDYFRANGGIDIFGYPRSEFMYENGHIVQYFQRARMEWHPEITSGPQMYLTNLGSIYVERFGVPGDYDKPVSAPPQIGNGAIQEAGITKLNISASVRYIITGREGDQTVFVFVNDQWQQPLQGANVRIVVKYQFGDQVYEFNEVTNSSGFARYHFDIQPGSPPGQKVIIDVIVTYGTLTGTTQTFFLPWW